MKACRFFNQAFHVKCVHKNFKVFFAAVRLKSPINIILSNLQVSLFKISDKLSTKYLSFVIVVYKGQSMQSHFRDMIENSTKIISQSLGTPSTLAVSKGMF